MLSMSVTPLLAPSNSFHHWNKLLNFQNSYIVRKSSLKTIGEAIKLVEQCLKVIQNNFDHVRYNRDTGLKSFNGPAESVSAATVDSIHLVDFPLNQLKDNTEKLGHKNINVLSCMTLSLEYLHLTVNITQKLF